MWTPLAERVIVVAGATSGLGEYTARALVKEGARLVVSGCRRQPPDCGLAVQADLTRAEDRRRLLDSAPGIYGLVVFTGMPARSPELAEESFRVNALAPLELARAAAERMRASSTAGAIVLLSTMQARAAFAGSAAYAAAKAALEQGMRVLAKEYRSPVNIRINAVAPGVMAAGMAEASIAAGKYRHYVESGAIPRYGHPQDVARVVRLLLEPDNYITGQTILVDGGLTL